MAEMIDFTTAEETKFEPLPAGSYKVRVENAEIKTAKDDPNNKHPNAKYVAWTYIVLEEPFQNRKLWQNTSMHTGCTKANCDNGNKVIGQFKSHLIALGVSEDALANKYNFEPTDFVGIEVRAVVAIGENNVTKEPNNSVKRVVPLDAVEAILP